MSLTFLVAVIIILRHAAFLHLSDLRPEAALTHVELAYREANIDWKIQQYLTASSQEHSVKQFAAFIMATDIGEFILASVQSGYLTLYAESTLLDLVVSSQSSQLSSVISKQESKAKSSKHRFKLFGNNLCV